MKKRCTKEDVTECTPAKRVIRKIAEMHKGGYKRDEAEDYFMRLMGQECRGCEWYQYETP